MSSDLGCRAKATVYWWGLGNWAVALLRLRKGLVAHLGPFSLELRW